ncbi:MAG: CAP domain-containing protein [Burkholderiales bacterium]|nr:MAG: CAP domain-containing protein [Burkholderiales bacterium]
MCSRSHLLPTLLLPALLLGADAWATEPGCQPSGEAAAAALNAVRAQAQACGRRTWPAAPALRESPVLAVSAQRYAAELARRDRIEHIGAAGDSLRARLREAGYVMRVSGENLAGGPETLDEALAQWLASPAHCENLMLADFQEFGLACVTGPGRFQRYWVLHVAAPAARPVAPANRPEPSTSP